MKVYLTGNLRKNAIKVTKGNVRKETKKEH